MHTAMRRWVDWRWLCMSSAGTFKPTWEQVTWHLTEGRCHYYALLLCAGIAIAKLFQSVQGYLGLAVQGEDANGIDLKDPAYVEKEKCRKVVLNACGSG